MREKDIKNKIDFWISLVETNLFNGIISGKLSMNRSSYFYASLLYLDLNDVDNARKCLFNSAYFNLLLHDLRFSTKYPYIDKKHLDSSYPSGVGWNPMQTAICCGSEAILERFFEHIDVDPKVYKSDYGPCAIMIKKGFITINQSLVNLHAVQLRKKKITNLRGYEKGDLMCLLGILDKDIAQFNEGIDIIVKAFKRDQTGNEVLNTTSLWATSMVKLAQRLGLEPDLSNSYINKEVLQWKDIIFEPDEELKSYEKQLEEMNTPGWVFDPSKYPMSERMKQYREDAREKEREENAKKGFFGKLFGK